MKGVPIFTFCNNKGGVGKSTVTMNNAAALSVKGKKVLIVDFDDSSNLSEFLKSADSREKAFPVTSYLSNTEIDLGDCVFWDTNIERMGLIPSTESIRYTINTVVDGKDSKLVDLAKRLKDDIQDLAEAEEIDYVFLDLPPAKDNSMFLAMLVATHVVYVVDLNFWAQKGVANMLNAPEMNLVRKHNPDQNWMGVLLNQIDTRNAVSKVLLQRDEFAELPRLPVYIPYRTEINSNSYVAEFAAFKNPETSRLSQAFHELAEWFIENVKIDGGVN